MNHLAVVRFVLFFEKRELGNMYQKVIHEIRSVDQNHWIFFEPQAFGVNQGLGSTLPKLQDPRLVYAPHLYPILLETSQSYKGLTKKSFNKQSKIGKIIE